ncbi:MAG: histone deacetylase family protein [Ectothiorhodospiraceae bacterium]|nr:histone deacetylase family protein [Ectothiorhodospiraceae bacterium]
MTTWIYTHDLCLQHDTGPGHPESSDRLRALLTRLRKPDFADLDWHEAPEATKEQLARVHDAGYVNDMLARIPKEGLSAIDGDTFISPASGAAALRAAGAGVAAVDAVMSGQTQRAFCAIRPPGHHAEPETAMGFCLFNNVAVAAAHARAEYHVDRVAVVDFDVHHGNGTQSMLAGKRGFMYLSTHEHPLFPGTGHGPVPGVDNVVNVPLNRFSGSSDFREAFREFIIPQLEQFGPQLLLISAGFDAHELDPLANLSLTTNDYAWATEQLTYVANRFCNGGIISFLEGGYDLHAVAEAGAAHIRTLSDNLA